HSPAVQGGLAAVLHRPARRQRHLGDPPRPRLPRAAGRLDLGPWEGPRPPAMGLRRRSRLRPDAISSIFSPMSLPPPRRLLAVDGAAPMQFWIHSRSTEMSLMVGRGSSLSPNGSFGGISAFRIRTYRRDSSGSPGMRNLIPWLGSRGSFAVSDTRFFSLSTSS